MIYGEETVPIGFGLGLNLQDHPANLPDGSCQNVKNMIAFGDRLVSRKGFSRYALNRGAGNSLYEINNQFYTRLPNSDVDSSWPVAMWYAGGTSYGIRQFPRTNPALVSGSGVSSFLNGVSPFVFKGACTYLSKFYVNDGNGIQITSSFNWSAGTLTFTPVSGGPTGTRGLFIFKDRMWCWDDTKIYYTDAVASPGAYPETWGSNFVVVSAGSGMGKIYSVIPSGTRLYIFTASGLYNISVLGSPANWVVRFMQDTVSVNSPACAIEQNGLIFFADVNGVWVTEGSEIKNLSRTIEPVFTEVPEDATQYYIFKLMPFEEGMMLLRLTVGVDLGLPFIAAETKIYYTRFDDILWTEWELNNDLDVGIIDVYASFARMETWENWNKNSWLALGHAEASNPPQATHDLCIYQGPSDVLLADDDSYSYSNPVVTSITSKLVRASFIDNKRSLYAYLNLSMKENSISPITAFNGTFSWSTEENSDVVTGSYETEFLNLTEGLIKFQGPEQWRYVIFDTTIALDDGIQELTLLGVVLINQTHRKELRGEA